MTDNFKPMLACDWFEDRLKFPCIVQPKIDGVRGLNRDGVLVGRSLRKHDNLHVTELFSIPELHGCDGEIYLGNIPWKDDLCRLSSQALRRIEGTPKVTWALFDYCTEDTKDLPYTQRMEILEDIVLLNLDGEIRSRIEIVRGVEVSSIEELLAYEEMILNQGFEGIIIRDPNAPYKYGRCGKTFMGCWRVKRFIDAEFTITEIEEGNTNKNAATINKLGRCERSTHKENMTPNGLVGCLKGRLCNDIIDQVSGNVLIKKGSEIIVSPGSMSHEDRKYYFENQHELINKIGKFKFFPKGIKDAPRFPIFLSLRNENDI